MGRSQSRPVVDPGSRCNYRTAEDDFLCLRYQVWYPSIDCAIRTMFRTCGGCLNCEQGRFNLKRHESALRVRFLRPPRNA